MGAGNLSTVAAGYLFSAVLFVAVLVGGCDRPAEGSPEKVADAFVDAYFRRADQEGAKQYTAFGASRMLDQEIAEVSQLRRDGHTPSEAQIDVAAERGARSSRGDRVRFDYTLRFRDPRGDAVKHADIELAMVDQVWKVVRVGVADQPAPPSAS
jgi:hypothetical protein